MNKPTYDVQLSVCMYVRISLNCIAKIVTYASYILYSFHILFVI